MEERQGQQYNAMKSMKSAMADREIILEGFDPISARGFTQIPNAILEDTNLNDGDKITYALLLGYGWDTNNCFPGQETLAERQGKKVRSIRDHLKSLEKKGWITIKQRGFNQTNQYTLRARVLKGGVKGGTRKAK